MPRKVDPLGCPKCSHNPTQVIKTHRRADGTVLRRRQCPICQHRWYTLQPNEEVVASYRVCFERTATNTPAFTILPKR